MEVPPMAVSLVFGVLWCLLALVGGGQFVRIATDSGLVRTGQTACCGYPSAVHEMIQTFRRYLIGQDPLRIEHHWQYLYRMGPFRGSVLSGAVSAVDIASSIPFPDRRRRPEAMDVCRGKRPPLYLPNQLNVYVA